jgi:hypothetical protein
LKADVSNHFLNFLFKEEIPTSSEPLWVEETVEKSTAVASMTVLPLQTSSLRVVPKAGRLKTAKLQGNLFFI